MYPEPFRARPCLLKFWSSRLAFPATGGSMRAARSVKDLHAGNGEDVCGFEEDWIEATDMTCPVCHCVPREAVAHICGKLFCHSCWSRWRTARERCPMCNDEESDAAPAYSDRINILNMQFRCHTCKQAVRLGDKKKHVEADCNRPTACPLCNSKVTPATLQEHMVGSCPRRLVPCPDCQAEMTASELEAHQDSLSCENQALHNKVRMLEKEITSTKDKLQKLKGEKKSTSKKVHILRAQLKGGTSPRKYVRNI